MAKKSATSKKRNVRVDAVGQLHVHSSFNNIIVSLANSEGQIISWSSAGKMGFRGSKKNTPYAAQMAAEDCAKLAFDLGLRKVKAYVKGPGNGASVVEKGNPSNGAVTDLDGNFSLNVKPGATIVVTYIGYKTQEIEVGAQSNINVTLKTDDKTLDEVVVVGYGVQKKKLVTGSTIEVKGDDIQKMNTTQVLGALQSQTPGVNIQAASGQPGDGFKISIRGAGTNGNTAPLYIIDGVAGDINNLNPADIERIDVLKDAASCAIYGSAAANGVILVTTKQGKQGKIQVSYDANVGWANVYRMPKMLTAKQYMEVMDQVRFNSGESGWDWKSIMGEDLYNSYMDGSNEGTNWVEAIRNKNAVTTSHSLNVTGGSDRSTFSMGAGYQYQDGVFGNVWKKTDVDLGALAADWGFGIRVNMDLLLLRVDMGIRLRDPSLERKWLAAPK